MIAAWPLDLFGKRRGARLRQAVLTLLSQRQGNVMTLSALARRLHCHRSTVYRGVRWLRSNGLLKATRLSRGAALRYTVTLPMPARRRQRTVAGPGAKYRRLLKRAAQRGLIDPGTIEAQVVEYELTQARHELMKSSLPQEHRSFD